MIENNLHWSLDITFLDEASRARKDNSPLNMNVLRKAALQLLNKARYGRVCKRRISLRLLLTWRLCSMSCLI